MPWRRSATILQAREAAATAVSRLVFLRVGNLRFFTENVKVQNFQDADRVNDQQGYEPYLAPFARGFP